MAEPEAIGPVRGDEWELYPYRFLANTMIRFVYRGAPNAEAWAQARDRKALASKLRLLIRAATEAVEALEKRDA